VNIISRYWNWKIALIAAIAAPLSVLVHELAHVGALEWGGVAAHLRGFSMGMPVGYSWNFKDLENAEAHFAVPGHVFAVAALAGPMTTLIIGYGGLLAYRWAPNPIFCASAFVAILLRMVGVTLNMPRFIDGSMDTSDEAIAAHFFGAPLSSFYWPSLLVGYLCIFLLVKTIERETRVSFAVSVFLGGAVGYFSIDTLANLLIFKPEVWMR
jgi:hypothetical protein